MLQLANATPFAAARTTAFNENGEHVWIVAVKGTYRYDGQGLLSLGEQEPVVDAPRYSGAPGGSTLLRDCELVMDHPGTAVTVYGSARPINGKPCTSMDVAFAVGPTVRRLKVFGDRHWRYGLAGLTPSQPEPFSSLPLLYEHAFGGADPGSATHYAANPIGKGYYAEYGDAAGQPLPNIEDPDALIHSWRERPAPAGFAAIPSGWSPRKELAGTVDQRWQKERAPLWPEDFQRRFFNAAPLPQQLPTKLKGGERLALQNISGQEMLALQLPRVMFDVRTKTRQGSVATLMELDRVIVEADQRKLILVWRGTLNCHSDVRQVIETIVDTKTNIRTGRRDGTG